MTKYGTTVSKASTYADRYPSRGRSVGLVAFLFGMTGRSTLPGTALRPLLGDLGVSPDAARALLSRMCRDGQLAGERHGRAVDYRLAGEFARGFERVREQAMARPLAWPGHFHAVLYHVPEDQRGFRDALRRTALLSGYGILQPGVLICTTDRSAQLTQALAAAPPGGRMWTTTIGMDPVQAAQAASTAWDLPGLAARYHSHAEGLTRGASAQGTGGSGSASGADALRTYVGTLQPILTDTMREPALPVDLLPADWPGPLLRKAIGGYTRVFAPTTGPYLRALLDPAGEPSPVPGAGLSRRSPSQTR